MGPGRAIPILKGDKGDSAYVYVAYASDALGSDFSETPGDNLNYFAVKSTNVAILTPSASDFAGLWKRISGGIASAGNAYAWFIS